MPSADARGVVEPITEVTHEPTRVPDDFQTVIRPAHEGQVPPRPCSFLSSRRIHHLPNRHRAQERLRLWWQKLRSRHQEVCDNLNEIPYLGNWSYYVLG